MPNNETSGEIKTCSVCGCRWNADVKDCPLGCKQLKRYEIESTSSYSEYREMVEREYGDWVKLEDVEKLVQEMRTIALREAAEKNLNDYANEVHAANEKWWVDLETGAPIKRNFGELIALCHSELSEALEGHRKNLMDDKLPHRKMAEVEMADCVIRIMDICAGKGWDLHGAYTEKMAYNAVRADHKRENRLTENGKKY